MARKASAPSYLHHKASKQAYTRINGRMIYLGDYDSKESRTKWAEIVSDWSAGNLDKYGESVSVSRLAVAYTRHAKTYYRKNGKETSEVHRVRHAMKHLVKEYRKLPADKFTPKHLERVRAKMIKKGFARKTINDYTAIIASVCTENLFFLCLGNFWGRFRGEDFCFGGWSSFCRLRLVRGSHFL